MPWTCTYHPGEAGNEPARSPRLCCRAYERVLEDSESIEVAPEPSALMTTADVAKMHGCATRTVVLSIKREELTATRVGAQWLIRRDDAESWSGPHRDRGGRPRKNAPPTEAGGA